MKKTLIFSFGLLILASCGGHKEAETVADTDTVIAENPADNVEATWPVAYLTKEGIGDLKIGAEWKDVPHAMEGLYSSRINGATQDAVTMEFMADDNPRFVAYDFDEGKIDVINLISSDVKVKTIKGDLSLGDQMALVLDLPGVTAEWSGDDSSHGTWYWKWEGLWFAPAQENISTTLSQRLYHAGQPPTIKDFSDENVKIGFIGTGLPF